MASLIESKDAEWLAAQDCLRAAQKLPAGTERIAALKEAGLRRLAARDRLLANEDADEVG
jgi:hypothetical protein